MPRKPHDPPSPPAPIVLLLRLLTGPVQPAVRLRRVLKALLRAFGLRCVRVIVALAEDELINRFPF